MKLAEQNTILGNLALADETNKLIIKSNQAPLAVVRKKLPPRKPTNASRRPREYLTKDEFIKVRTAIKNGGNANRNELMLLLMAQHGLRISELLRLRFNDVNLKAKTIYIRRLKNGKSGEHMLYSAEVKLLSKLRRQWQPCDNDYIFKGYNNSALTPNAVHKIIYQAGIDAGLSFPLHCHMARHSTGYALVNRQVPIVNIGEYMGHRRLSSTMAYIALDNNRFKNFDSIFS